VVPAAGGAGPATGTKDGVKDDSAAEASRQQTTAGSKRAPAAGSKLLQNQQQQQQQQQFTVQITFRLTVYTLLLEHGFSTSLNIIQVDDHCGNPLTALWTEFLWVVRVQVGFILVSYFILEDVEWLVREGATAVQCAV